MTWEDERPSDDRMCSRIVSAAGFHPQDLYRVASGRDVCLEAAVLYRQIKEQICLCAWAAAPETCSQGAASQACSQSLKGDSKTAHRKQA